METFLGGKVALHCGDVREQLRLLPDDSFDCVVTSPPYWGLRDYGVVGQIGLEPTLGEHLEVMVSVFREVRRVLKSTGTLWLNYGDCYAASPNGRAAVAIVNDDRTFRDKPFSTVGAIYDPDGGAKGKGGGAGKHRYKDDLSPRPGRVVGLGRLAKWDRKSERNGHNFGASDESVADVRVMPGGYLKPKDLCMVSNRLAIALQDDGWWVRSEIIWHKPNPMPESTRDRPTSSHEKIWLLTKCQQYFFDQEAVREEAITQDMRRPYAPGQVDSRGNGHDRGDGQLRKTKVPGGWDTGDGGHGTVHRNGRTEAEYVKAITPLGRNIRNVWTVGTAAFSEAHFATFPPAIAERCIKAGCPIGGAVLDPFGGAGTTALVAASLGRTATLIELNQEYARLARSRIEAAFMGREEGIRHMVKQTGKLSADAGPLFTGVCE